MSSSPPTAAGVAAVVAGRHQLANQTGTTLKLCDGNALHSVGLKP